MKGQFSKCHWPNYLRIKPLCYFPETLWNKNLKGMSAVFFFLSYVDDYDYSKLYDKVLNYIIKLCTFIPLVWGKRLKNKTKTKQIAEVVLAVCKTCLIEKNGPQDIVCMPAFSAILTAQDHVHHHSFIGRAVRGKYYLNCTLLQQSEVLCIMYPSHTPT